VDPVNVWGDRRNLAPASSTTSANGETAAVDAHFGVQVAWDMFRNVFGRNGIDGEGHPIYNRVHYGVAFANAFFHPQCGCTPYGSPLRNCPCLTFGDGDGRTASWTAIDVTAHELSHGVTAFTARLAYMGEAGGLNEATSDIFGTLAEFYFRGSGYDYWDQIPETGGNWTFGEQISLAEPPRPLRWMDRPFDDNASPNAWSMILARLDPHFSSGPMNRCFYFLSQGASSTRGTRTYSAYLPEGMTGIGNDRAGRIWYLALTGGDLGSGATYVDAREAALQAAADRYGIGSPEQQAVCNAFAAINVGFPCP
jgi:Zn-dependent metalloprotease